MRFIIDDFEAPKAEKIFVDRVEPRQIFWQHYEQANSAPMEVPVVLSYYGVGGIGKTALNQQLKKELTAQYPKAKYLELDFDFVERREPYRILALMRKKLSEQYKFTFPMFEVAYYSLLLHMGEEASKPEAQSVISSSPVLSFLCNSASFVPGGEIISSVLQLADEGVALFRNSFSKRKNMLKKLTAADPKQLLQELPIYFAADLRENLAKEKHPFVMFLDTYEKLVNEMAAIGDPLRNDLWLRGDKGIIARLPNVIWVIGGREKLKWEQLDTPGHWDGVLHQYLLGTLSQQDASEFLTGAGVTDIAVQKQIYTQTEGLPVYLDLCVEQYLQDGQTALSGNSNVLFERCTRYMNDQEKNILFLLACLETWTEETAYAAGQQMPFDFSPVFYEKLLSFSFVLTNDGVHYTLMRQIGQILREHCPPAIRRACMNLMVQADTAAEVTDIGAEEPAQMDVARYMQLLLADIQNEEDLNNVMNELEDQLFTLVGSYQLTSFYEYLAPLWQIAAEQYPDSYAFARILTFHSMALYKIGEYEQAEQTGVAALQQLQRIKGELSAVEVAASNMALQYSERCLFHKIPQLFVGLWQELADAFGEDHLTVQSIAQIIAASYSVLEQAQEEALWKSRFNEQEVAELAAQYEPTEIEQELDAMNQKAAQLLEAQDYQGYVDHQLAAINRSQELLGPYNLDMLKMMEDLAKNLNDMKMHEDALEVQQEAVTRYTDSIGLHDGTTAMARVSLYNYLCDSGRGAEALQMAPEIIEDLNCNFGSQYAMTLNFRFNVACERMIQLEEEIAGEEDLLAILQVMEELREEMLACPAKENTLLREVEDMIAVLRGENREEPKQESKKAVLGVVSAEAARQQRAAEKRVDDIWIIGDEMEKRIKKAVNTYAVDIDETDVLLQVDGTVRRNGKAGFVFTQDMVFFKATFDEGSALITNIEDIRPGKTEVLLYIKGRSPVKVITAQEQAVCRILRAFLGLD